MTDIPIIFSAPMVRALLAGRKTMTRRIIKLPTKGEYVRPDMGGWAATTVGGGKSFVVKRDGTREPAREVAAIWNQTTGTCIASRWQAGDRLWVRESLRRFDREPATAQYVADITGVVAPHDQARHVNGAALWNWSRPSLPSIHMPRWASRLTLIVTAVKVEPLQDISEADAIAEGIEATEFWRDDHPPSICFSVLWNALHGTSGDHSWDANPWVVAPTFRVIKTNIDAPEMAA